MGLAILAIYIPTFLIVAAIAAAVGVFIERKTREAGVVVLSKDLAYFSGAIAALLLSTACAWCYSKIASGFEGVVVPIAISLIGPSIVGFVAYVLWGVWLRHAVPSLAFAAAGALQSTTVMPLLGIAIYAAFDGLYGVIFRPTFEILCSPAKVEIVEAVEPPKGIAVIPRFMHPRRHAQSDPVVLLLSERTSLQFVEEVDNSSARDVKFIRVTRRESLEGQNTRKRYEELFLTAPVTSLSSEYNVKFSELEVPRIFKLGGETSGQRIVVERLADKKTVAIAEGYWNYQQESECPTGFGGGEFVTDFVSKALNIPKPSNYRN